jgi:hypothetical protein
LTLSPHEIECKAVAETKIVIELPDCLYGQAVAVDLSPDGKNMYTCYVDGAIHSSGSGMPSWRAWPEPGSHEISFIAPPAEGSVVSKWSDMGLVSAADSIRITVRKGDKTLFSAPGGYDQVTRLADGKIVAEKHPGRAASDSQEIIFKSKGRHILTCRVQGSVNGNFGLITWLVDAI